MPESSLSMDSVSVLLVWTAICVYALAFIAYAADLAVRSDGRVSQQRTRVRNRQLVGVAAGGAETVEQLHAREQRAADYLERRAVPPTRPVWARMGTTLTGIAFLFHFAADVTRGIAIARVPWSNMYEFALTGTLLIVAVYLGVLFRYDLRFLGSFVIGLVILLLGASAIGFYRGPTPLADPLKSVWLVVHVFVASLATALFALAFALSLVQLLQMRREQRVISGQGAAGPRFLRRLPSADFLESLAYRFTIVGFVFWSFTLIAGSIWANDAWGRFWGFDTKEVWTFIIWVLYAGYIHARATRGWRGARSAWLCMIGFGAVLFNFTIVNIFFKGLHSYSGLS